MLLKLCLSCDFVISLRSRRGRW